MHQILAVTALTGLLLAPGASQAARLLERGDFEKAAKAARTVVGKDPADIQGWEVLADALCGLGRPNDDWAEIGTGMDKNPKNAALTKKLGDIFCKIAEKERAAGGDPATPLNFYGDAERMYGEAIKLDPKLAGAYYGKAHAGLKLGAKDPERRAAARQLLGQCLTLDPNYVEAHSLQAFLLYEDGNTARSKGNESLAMEKYRAAENKYAVAIKLGTKDPLDYVRHGHCFYAQGKLDEAKQAYLQQIVHFPENDTAIRSGLYYLAKRNWRNAAPLLEEATKAAPKSFVAWYWYGYTLFVTNRLNEALRAYGQADKLSPNNSTTLYMIGYCYEKANDADKALRSYRKALEANPDNTDAAGRMSGIIVANRADIDRAEKLYEELIKLAPRNGFILNDYALVLRDWAERRGAAKDKNPPADVKRRIKRSGQVYEMAAALLPDDPQIQSDTGLLFEFYPANFDAKKAKAYFTHALDISDYTYRDAFDGLNRLCHKTGDWETLRDYAESVVGTIERGNQAVAPAGGGPPRTLPNETPGLLARAKKALAEAEAKFKGN